MVQAVSPSFFTDLHMSLVSGRNFNDGDNANSLPVAIVSEKLARIAWPGLSPIGRHLSVDADDNPGWLTIIGVAPNTEYNWFDNDPEKVVYRPYRQAPSDSAYFALRAGVAPFALIKTFRRQMSAIDPALPLSDAQTLAEGIHDALSPIYLVGALMTGLGAIALLVAAAGIYGLVAFTVSRRTQEIGIRMALGARRHEVVRLIVSYEMAINLIGMLIGSAGALVLTRVAAGFFYGVHANDRSPFFAVLLILFGTSLLAALIPARRAANVDPMVAVRYE
jgi:putative ABC transport system permease protein